MDYRKKKQGGLSMKTEFIATNQAPAAVGPYSQGVKTGNLIFTSGQLPMDTDSGELIKGSIGDMTNKCLENVKAILNEAGADISNIVKVTVFVTDVGNFSAINEVYAEFFGDHKPARSLVEVSKLPKDAEIEIEAIAAV